MSNKDWERFMQLVLAYGDAKLSLGSAIERGQPLLFKTALNASAQALKDLIDFEEDRSGSLYERPKKLPADIA